jgi:hypothetical protein
MANTLLNVDKITNAALVILHQKLNFIGSINRSYDDSFAVDGAKIGSTLRIRLPNQYTIRTGPALSTQDVVEQNTALTVATQIGVDTNFTTTELTMNIFDFSQQVLEPAMAVIASNIEAQALSMVNDVYNVVPGFGAAQTFRNVLLGGKALDDNLAPMDGNRMIRLNTQDNVDLVDGLKGLFQNSTTIAKQYTSGVMGTSGGFEFAQNTLVPAFTRGAYSATYVVSGAGQTGSALVVGTGTGAVNKGDVFTIAGVFRVHPETKANTGVLQSFVCTAAYAGGGGTMQIAPAISTAGGTQNVSAAPANSALLVFAGTANGTSQQSIAYHRDAFAFATADLIMPEGVHFAARKVMDGISLRVVRQYDVNTDRMPTRIDCLFGFKTIRPQLACRLASN